MTMLTIKIINEEGKEFVLEGVAYTLYLRRRLEDERPQVYMDWIQSMDVHPQLSYPRKDNQ